MAEGLDKLCERCVLVSPVKGRKEWFGAREHLVCLDDVDGALIDLSSVRLGDGSWRPSYVTKLWVN